MQLIGVEKFCIVKSYGIPIHLKNLYDMKLSESVVITVLLSWTCEVLEHYILSSLSRMSYCK